MVEENKKQEIKPGMKVKVFEKLREKGPKGETEERLQAFEGVVIAKHKKKEIGATITVRKISADGVGVEKIYPLYSPLIDRIEVLGQYKTRKAKLYYLRNYKKKLKEEK